VQSALFVFEQVNVSTTSELSHKRTHSVSLSVGSCNVLWIPQLENQFQLIN
jgi:hypothetical protein